MTDIGVRVCEDIDIFQPLQLILETGELITNNEQDTTEISQITTEDVNIVDDVTTCIWTFFNTTHSSS